MANITSNDDIIQPPNVDGISTLQLPLEQFEVEEPVDVNDNIIHPSGAKLWLTMTSLCITFFLNGLDLTAVAVAVPALTDEFKTVSDIGWYNAAYGMTLSAFVFFFGRVYVIYPPKTIFMIGILIFELGSLLCTLAPTSKVFILGRAIAGIGSSATGGGLLKILSLSFPLSKQALMGGLAGGSQSIGLVIAPVLGGALIDAWSWRACFGINLPLGALCLVLTWYGFADPAADPSMALPWKQKLRQLNILSTLLVVPAIASFLMALQWGGSKYGWGNPRIVTLLVLFGVLFSIFGYVQYRQGDEATLPPRILRKRSILAAMWFSACCNGILAMTEYYISIYFQGVRGFTATKSGLLGLPMIAGFAVAAMGSAVGTTKIGYYFPFMFATSILAPVASGLLTTLDLSASIAKPALLLAFLGFAIGLGIQSPQLAVQTVLSPADVSIGGAVVLFGAGMGSALWICASSTLFNERLVAEVARSAPRVNGTMLSGQGLSDIREHIGEGNLGDVLSGYNRAVVQTLYLPLALGVATILGSVAMERRSIKKKQS